MSSTNKTTNYELSQFLSTDKPAWLTDYNQDMSKIDNGINTAQLTATGADGKADANTTNIGDMTYLSTTAKNTLVAAINEVDGNTDVANQVASNALNTANTAKTTAENIADSFNLTPTAYTYQNATQISGASASMNAGNYWLATNTEGTLCKIYGNLNVNASASSGSCTIKLIDDSGLRPTSEFQVSGCAEAYDMDNYLLYPRFAVYTFKTNGEIDVTFTKTSNKYTTIRMYACLIIVKDFGDTPEA